MADGVNMDADMHTPDDSGPSIASSGLGPNPVVERRGERRSGAAPRAARACTFCKSRKAKCSGEWPTCKACKSRSRDCLYPGHQSFAVANIQTSSAPPSQRLPSDDLRRIAIAHFRKNYAPTLLCFIPPQRLIEDDTGQFLPLSLLLCIITLTSKFIPEFASSYPSTVDVGGYFLNLAEQELNATYNEPSLTTVQCCLILCVYELGEGVEHRGWLRLGHAVRLAQLLQLHRQDTGQRQFNWGSSAPVASVSMAESKRRTFWCCFCLDKLFANGRDRIAIFTTDDITTLLPQCDDDFIYGREVNLFRLNQPPGALHVTGPESIFSYTVRVVEILGKVLTWHGRGGRQSDHRCPWLPDMPFTMLDRDLQQWRKSVPHHLDYTPQNSVSVIAAGQGRAWSLMYLLYFQARAYLHREYLPFTPRSNYDPSSGPCDGPPLVPQDCEPPGSWWRDSAIAMIESANAISDIYTMMHSRGLSASAYPIPGLGLLTAASIHTLYAIFGWNSMRSIITEEVSKNYLRQDMAGFNDLGQRWDLAVHWIRQVTLFYKLNLLTRHSMIHNTSSDIFTSSINIPELVDGLMNYVRQVGQQDGAIRRANLKRDFDFEGWLKMLDDSVKARIAIEAPRAALNVDLGVGDGGNTEEFEEAEVGNLDLEMDLQQDTGSVMLFDIWDSWAFEESGLGI